MPKKILGCVILALLILGAAGCKQAVAPGRIVFLGDSLTAGYGLEPTEAYPALIQIDQMECVNLGVSGDEVSQGLTRLQAYFAKGNDASLVVIALGANDILHGASPGVMTSGLKETIGECKSRDIPVLLCGVNIPLLHGSEGFKTVAKEEKVPFMPDLLASVLGHRPLMQGDDAHPNAEGQKVIAQHMEKALRSKFRLP